MVYSRATCLQRLRKAPPTPQQHQHQQEQEQEPEQGQEQRHRHHRHHHRSANESRLLSLPLELQIEVIRYLDYPDGLALKFVHPHFYILLTSSLDVRSRAAWLGDRLKKGLLIPVNETLNMRTDASFVRNHGITIILRNRRHHMECAAVWLSNSQSLQRQQAGLNISLANEKRLKCCGCLVDRNVRACSAMQKVMDGQNPFAKTLDYMQLEMRPTTRLEDRAAIFMHCVWLRLKAWFDLVLDPASFHSQHVSYSSSPNLDNRQGVLFWSVLLIIPLAMIIANFLVFVQYNLSPAAIVTGGST